MSKSRSRLTAAPAATALVSLLSSVVAPAQATPAVASLGRLPLAFVANDGQLPQPVGFLARTPGADVFLTRDGAVLDLRGPCDRAAALRITFAGSRGAERLLGQDALPGKVNDLRGDPSRWRTNIASYARVEATEVYPGVDAVYYGNGRSLEFDLRVAPGADASALRLRLEGADGLAVDAAGDLHVAIAGGEVELKAPVVYQEGAAGRTPVEGRYIVASKDEVAFELCGHDPADTVVIDPVVAYSTFLGGSLLDVGRAIAVDPDGNAYVAGYTASTTFPTTSGALQTTYRGGLYDSFVTKVAPDGGSLVYSTFLGGNGQDEAWGIAIDPDGNAYVSGYTTSTDFSTTANGFRRTLSGSSDTFLCKLAPAGDALVYSTYYGGSSTEGHQVGVRVDSSGAAYVAGYTDSTNLPTTATAYSRTMTKKGSSGKNGFLAKFNPGADTGPASLVYATYFGGGTENQSAVAVDGSGRAYLGGITKSSNFPTTPGAYDRTYNGGWDTYVAKIDPAVAGKAGLVYSTFLGGSADDYGGPVDVNAAGEAFVAGSTSSTNFPTTSSAFSRTLQGTADAFVTRLNAAGSALRYSTYLGGTNPGPIDNDGASSVAIDGATGTAVLVGSTNSPNWPVTANAIDPTINGTYDAFLAELDTNASGAASLLYSSFLGGSTPDNNDGASAVAVGPAGSWFVTGLTFNTDFPVTPGAFQTTFGGARDGYVVRQDR